VNDLAISHVKMEGVLNIIKREFLVSEISVPITLVYRTAGKDLKLNKSETKWIIHKLVKSNQITCDKSKIGFVMPILKIFVLGREN
jgi:hypothetical protein